MARIRTIKPEFWTDEKVVALSPLARLLFIGLWNFVDDEGRAPFSPTRFKMQILPADSADISELFGEIRCAGLITIYVVDNREFLQVCGFGKHQKVDHRQHSKHPSPPNCPELPRNVSPDQGSRIKEGIKESISSAPRRKRLPVAGQDDPEFEEWYRNYPRREARAAAHKAYLAARKIADAETLLAGAKAAKSRFPDLRFTPLPASWLNGQRWEDDATAAPRVFKTGGGFA